MFPSPSLSEIDCPYLRSRGYCPNGALCLFRHRKATNFVNSSSEIPNVEKLHSQEIELLKECLPLGYPEPDPSSIDLIQSPSSSF